MKCLCQKTISDLPNPLATTHAQSKHIFIHKDRIPKNSQNLMTYFIMVTCKVQVICLSETHYTMRHHFSIDDISMSNIYHIRRHDRNEHGGSVAMCVNTWLDQKRLHMAQTLIETGGGTNTHTAYNIFCIDVLSRYDRHVYIISVFFWQHVKMEVWILLVRSFCIKVSKNIPTF